MSKLRPMNFAQKLAWALRNKDYSIVVKEVKLDVIDPIRSDVSIKFCNGITARVDYTRDKWFRRSVTGGPTIKFNIDNDNLNEVINAVAQQKFDQTFPDLLKNFKS